MSLPETVLKVLKEQMLPEIGELKQGLVEVKDTLAGIVRVQEALIARLDRAEEESARRFALMEKRFEQVDARFEQMDKRFEQMDKRFEQMDKRIEQIEVQMKASAAEHSRQMELLDKRMDRLETTVHFQSERLVEVREAVGRLSLLGDYVRRIDDMAAELRELRRRQEELERRVQTELLPRLPKPASP
ncbi:MAG: hypothetical protein HY814_14605 [Candidatus Riflebacteria bacterium]|nr:hypothetical protein [Candidatus Riflebacteria bacterium]